MTYRVFACFRHGDSYTIELVADTGANEPPVMTLRRQPDPLPIGTLLSLS